MAKSGFSQAFKEARQSGEKTFKYNGKSYGTRLKGESDAAYEKALMKSRKSTNTKVDLKSKPKSLTPTPKPSKSKPVGGSAVPKSKRDSETVKELEAEALKRRKTRQEYNADKEKLGVSKPGSRVTESKSRVASKKASVKTKTVKPDLKGVMDSQKGFKKSVDTKLAKREADREAVRQANAIFQGGELDEVTVTAKKYDAGRKKHIIKALNKARAKRRARKKK